MHKTLLGEQLLLAFHVGIIRDTTIHRAYGRTLGLFVEAHALRAFVRGYIVDFIADGLLYGIRIHRLPIGQHYLALQGGPIAVAPFISAFVDCGIRAFRFACPAIYTLIGDNYRHSSFLFQRLGGTCLAEPRLIPIFAQS